MSDDDKDADGNVDHGHDRRIIWKAEKINESNKNNFSTNMMRIQDTISSYLLHRYPLLYHPKNLRI